MQAELIWALGAQLGEGPVWLPEERCLWFVDIKRGALHRYTPESDARESFAIGGQPSFVVPAQGGGLIIGSELSLLAFHPAEGTRPIAAVPAHRGDRTNDGCVDARGRLWFGTMDDGEQRESGRIWCYDGSARAVAGDCAITNGPAVSADGAWLYHVDTLAGTLWRHPLRDDGSLGPETLFVQIPPSDGYPDGIVCDAEGALWVALWGGAAAHRYAPDGRLVARVDLPTAQPTKIAFGGDDLRTAFVTSARVGLDPAAHPEAGGLFAFETDVPGFASHKVAR